VRRKGGALFPLRQVEGGARLREHVALELALGLAEANRFLQARLDDGVVGKTKSAQNCAHKQLSWGNCPPSWWSNLLIYLMFLW
jgi:hypothetical protein